MNELTLNGSLVYNDGITDDSLDIAALVQSVTTQLIAHYTMTCTTGGTAMSLAGLSNIGYAMVVNRDPNNFVTIETAASTGKLVGVLKPNGGFSLMYHGSDLQAPYLFANTSSCKVEVFLCSQ